MENPREPPATENKPGTDPSIAANQRLVKLCILGFLGMSLLLALVLAVVSYASLLPF